MTNEEIYEALSKPGRKGAKAELAAMVGCSRNMVRLILKGEVVSGFETELVKAAIAIIERYEAKELLLANWRLKKAQERLKDAQDFVKQVVTERAA